MSPLFCCLLHCFVLHFVLVFIFGPEILGLLPGSSFEISLLLVFFVLVDVVNIGSIFSNLIKVLLVGDLLLLFSVDDLLDLFELLQLD